MQYVGRLVSSVYNTITPNINPATLSGAIDVIVVEKRVDVDEEVEVDAAGNELSPDELHKRDRDATAAAAAATTSSAAPEQPRRTKKVKRQRLEYASTPFHVRFGKMSVLRPAERKVTLHLNNSPDPLPFAMKVADSGEAFFVLEIDDNDERDRIPDDLVTSPILSASASPITSPDLAASQPPDGDDQQQFVPASSAAGGSATTKTSEVEPLDLGESRVAESSGGIDLDEPDIDARSATTVRSGTTAETSITTPSMGRTSSGDAAAGPSTRSPKSDVERETDEANDAGDLDVPGDSSRTGSGPAGSSSLLDKVGTAASKASGALGAAGRAAVGAGTRGNAKLENVARKAQRADGGNGADSAGVDDGQEGHDYEPERGGPAGKRRQQDREQVRDDEAPRSEAERLEQQLKDRATGVIRAEVEAWEPATVDGNTSAESQRGLDREAAEAEEHYPEPFGSTTAPRPSAAALADKTRKDFEGAAAARAERSTQVETYPVATSRHSEYLGGRKLQAVPGVDADHPIDPAMVDASLLKARQRESKSQQGQQRGHGGRDDDGDETAVDDVDDDGDVDRVRASKERKEDVQYMLDMDGYKMTADGEDLAFQEGNRLADEMPLGRRHGGNGRHGHSDKLNGPGHKHKVSLPTTSTASLRRRSASKSHRPSISMDYRKQKAIKTRDRSGTLGALDLDLDDSDDDDDDDDGTLDLAPSRSGRRGQDPSAKLTGTSHEQDELSLTRDLARLARMNRASDSSGPRLGAGAGADAGSSTSRPGRSQALHPVDKPSQHRRHASLSYGRSPSGRSSPALAGNRTRGVPRRAGRPGHFQEFSLSDTEAEVPNAKSTSGRNSLASSTESIKGADGRLSRLTPALRDLKMPGDETPPQVVLDDTATAHLGHSSNLSWQWGELAPRTSAAGKFNAGPPSGYRRTRFASTDAYEARGHSAEVAQALGRYSQDDSALTGKLTSSDWEPYVFRLELEDASHTFELSLCYKEGFGGNGEGDYYDFEENRVSFQRFVDDEDVVNDERLVVRYNDRFLTWENASTVLATLSLYRKTLSPAASGGQDAAQGKGDGGQSRTSKASYWSRWWSRSAKSIPDLKEASAEQQQQQQQERDVSEAKARAAREASAPPAGGLLPAPDRPIERSATDSILDQRHLVATPDSTEADKNLDGALAGRSSKAAAGAAKKTSNKTYAKTLRLTSDQLKSLNLRKGANTITFSVTSSYSGVATCTARIFLWESSHKIVVSDIDGTITKSDALGHVFTMIGRDWTHIGVAKLYTDIARNGYRIMYLTSRAIGQADTTRDYLKGVKQNNYVLPDGPVIMSPDRLMASLHREVILRKPEVFKMACLRDIARLFGADPRTAQAQPGGNLANAKGGDGDGDGHNGQDSNAATATATAAAADGQDRGEGRDGTKEEQQRAKAEHATPFYAGFGNRITDALSYRSVNIPSSRIFTIDSNGEVKMELLELAGYKSSYIHMTDLVDQMFPPITAKEEKEPRRPEFNDFNYWRPDIVDVELPPDEELLAPALEPVSPALSARSGKSVRSLRSVRSATSDGGSGGLKDAASLGLSRKGSASTIPADGSSGGGAGSHGAVRHSSVGPGVTAEQADLEEAQRREQRARSASPELESSASSPPSSSSYGGGVTSWTAPWRRRGASPEPGRATSPLVGASIVAEPESEDEGQERFYDSEGDDDDVSSFEGRGLGEGGSEDEGEELEFGRPAQVEGRGGQGDTGRGVRDGDEGEGEGDEDEDEDEEFDDPAQDDDDDDDDDPLLATGEIRFEWRG
ncbi:uncharacterized protein PFL1_02154 [Pseudozyma flocculosa PF-1]|uniref:uncharacterized protein n=1 Tax=Pseudozyma flocculosa PF-1 TaxID=1277687 RepID=UPI000456095E|nr:uncharacterized protein PFL1_02154 [Pseudozyma flocculosa PF-1]EPQ30036.1 hypothetical protein PFL1_02154 [Pseudozyma flocculosa PF-1]